MAGFLLSIVCLARRTPIGLNRRAIIYYIVIGVIGIDLAYIMLVFSVRHLTVGYVSVLVLFSPLLTYVFAILLRIERINLLRGLGILVGFCRCGGFSWCRTAACRRRTCWGWRCWPSSCRRATRRRIYLPNGAAPPDADNVALAAGTMFAAAGGALIVTLIAGNFHPVWVDFAQREVILFGFSLATAIAFLIFYLIVALAGAVYLGQVGYIVTLAGVGWGVLFFGESVPVMLWVAIAIVGVGVGMVNLGKKRPA